MDKASLLRVWDTMVKQGAPGVCRYYDEKAGTYTCPACLHRSPYVRQAGHRPHIGYAGSVGGARVW